MTTEPTAGPGAETTPSRPARPATLPFALFSLLPAAVLFTCAGSARWGAGWLYAATLWIVTVGTRLLALRFSPAMIAERASSIRRADIAPWDRWIMPIIAGLGPLATWIVGGLSFRFGWLAGMPPAVRLGALGLLAASSALVTWSMLTNPFFSAVVRIQRERDHAVVSRGPYRLVRHPGYLGMLLANLATPFVLDAPWTLVAAGLVAVLLVLRTSLEDRKLVAELPGYADYARATRARLLPGLW